METSQQQISLFTEEESILLAEGSRAKTQVLPSNGVKVNRGFKVKEQDYFGKCAGLSRKSDLNTLSPKTSLTFLKLMGGGDFRTLLSELASMGYNAEWRICYASDVGAPHNRARMYIVAYPCSIRLQPRQTFFSHVYSEASQVGWDFAGTSVQTFRGGSWSDKPPVLCVDDGVPSKLVRQSLHGYGNAVIPQIAESIFKSIQEYENSTNQI